MKKLVGNKKNNSSKQKAIGTGPDGEITGYAYTIGLAGDISQNKQTAQNMMVGNPDFLINVGDFGYSQDEQKWVTDVMSPTAGKEQWGSLGNHDNGPKYLSINFFKNTNWDYSFVKGNIAFVCANTETQDTQKLDELLSQYDNDPAIKWIFVFGHKSIFIPQGISLSPDADREFQAVMEKHPKVKSYWAGHNHFYARMIPVNGILHVTIGQGGRNNSSGPNVYATVSRINGAVRAGVTDDSTMHCKVYANEEDGSTLIDEFIIGSDGTLPEDGEKPKLNQNIRNINKNVEEEDENSSAAVPNSLVLKSHKRREKYLKNLKRLKGE